MNLFTQGKQTHRLRMNSWLPVGGWGRCGKEAVWEGLGERIVREFGVNMYALLYLKWITNKDLLKHMACFSMLIGSLDEKGVWRRMDTCIAESLYSPPETITTLLINYTPIQNKKFFFFLILVLEKYFQGIMPNSYCCLVPKSCPTLLWPPWTVAHQVPLSVGFSRQEYWSGLPFPSPGDLPNAGIKPASPAVGEVGEWRCVLYLCATREALPLLFNWWDDYIPTHAVRHWLQFQLSVKSGASHLKIFLCLNFSSLSMVSNRNKMWTTHVILNVLGVPLKE